MEGNPQTTRPDHKTNLRKEEAMSGVLVLNAGYEPLQYVSVKHAIKNVINNKAVIHESVEGQSYGSFPMPLVIRLKRYVNMHWRGGMPKYSHKRLHARDRNKCVYCGDKSTTVDHVNPRGQGGVSEWLNTVAACFPCNNKKGMRTPEEAGLLERMSHQPFTPKWEDLYY